MLLLVVVSSRAAYGRTPDGDIQPDQVNHIRQVAQALIEGRTSLFRACHTLNAAGQKTTRGNPWTYNSLRRTLLSLAMTADPPILTQQQQQQLARVLDTSTSRGGRPRGGSAALLGDQALKCARCASFMTVGHEPDYRCPQGQPVPGGGISCGNNNIARHIVDRYVRERTVAELKDPGARQRVAQVLQALPPAAADGAPKRSATAAQVEQANNAMTAYQRTRAAQGFTDAAEARRVRARAQRMLAAARRRLHADNEAVAQVGSPPAGADVGRWFDALPVAAQQIVVDRLWSPVQVLPQTAATWRLAPLVRR